MKDSSIVTLKCQIILNETINFLFNSSCLIPSNIFNSLAIYALMCVCECFFLEFEGEKNISFFNINDGYRYWKKYVS